MENKDFLKSALDACKKFNSELKGPFDGPMQSETEVCSTAAAAGKKYNLQDEDVLFNLLSLKSAIENERQKYLNYDELIAFLRSAMNYGDMQIWLIRKQMEGTQLSLEDQLKRFFETTSIEDILTLYDLEQNKDQNNINNVRNLIRNNQ